MHCEKKLCENILKIVFGAKDVVAIKEDLKECGI
jgi:hypothetical protein